MREEERLCVYVCVRERKTVENINNGFMDKRHIINATTVYRVRGTRLHIDSTHTRPPHTRQNICL